MEQTYDFLRELDNTSYMYWHPIYKDSGIDFDLFNVAPVLGDLRANYCTRILTFSYKKHVLMFKFQRLLGGQSSVIMTIWNGSGSSPVIRYFEINNRTIDFRKSSKEDLGILLKRTLLGAGLYTLSCLAPRMRKAVFELTDKISDPHINRYFVGKGYILSKHHERWRLHYQGKLCKDIVHLCMITEQNLYHWSV